MKTYHLRQQLLDFSKTHSTTIVRFLEEWNYKLGFGVQSIEAVYDTMAIQLQKQIIRKQIGEFTTPKGEVPVYADIHLSPENPFLYHFVYVVGHEETLFLLGSEAELFIYLGIDQEQPKMVPSWTA